MIGLVVLLVVALVQSAIGDSIPDDVSKSSSCCSSSGNCPSKSSTSSYWHKMGDQYMLQSCAALKTFDQTNCQCQGPARQTPPTDADSTSSCVSTAGTAASLSNSSMYYQTQLTGLTWAMKSCRYPGTIYSTSICSCTTVNYILLSTQSLMDASRSPLVMDTCAAQGPLVYTVPSIRNDGELAQVVALLVAVGVPGAKAPLGFCSGVNVDCTPPYGLCTSWNPSYVYNAPPFSYKPPFDVGYDGTISYQYNCCINIYLNSHNQGVLRYGACSNSGYTICEHRYQ